MNNKALSKYLHILLIFMAFFMYSCSQERETGIDQEGVSKMTNTNNLTPPNIDKNDEIIGIWYISCENDSNLTTNIVNQLNISNIQFGYCLKIEPDFSVTIYVPFNDQTLTLQGKIISNEMNYTLILSGLRQPLALTRKHALGDDDSIYIKLLKDSSETFNDGSKSDGHKWNIYCEKIGIPCTIDSCIEYYNQLSNTSYPYNNN